MPPATLLRVLALVAGVAGVVLVAGGLALGWLAVVAARRGEGVFVPVAGVALLAVAGGGALVRWAAERLGGG
ncbi:MAG TPA: hypothetical protein VNA89_10210 [Gemmatimonadaceae bacterium]|nr:hypothetical protein [Gemmatimonadaceae bacterium]